MTTVPGAARLIKGSIIGMDLFNPLASVIIFQYNPTEMTRRLQAATGQPGGAESEVLRLNGAPSETFDMTVEIDATDQLETGDGVAQSMGIYPQLSSLEMLLYPKSAQVILNSALMAAGITEIVPPEAPFTLFVWGPRRVVPVKLEGFSITEKAHDTGLNPIRAEVALSLTVLSYNDFNITHPGFATFMAHQIVKEAMAVVGSVAGAAGVVGGG